MTTDPISDIPEVPDAHVGDWVRFYRDARLVIGEVRYVVQQFGIREFQTDMGNVHEDAVLEVRRASR